MSIRYVSYPTAAPIQGVWTGAAAPNGATAPNNAASNAPALPGLTGAPTLPSAPSAPGLSNSPAAPGPVAAPQLPGFLQGDQNALSTNNQPVDNTQMMPPAAPTGGNFSAAGAAMHFVKGFFMGGVNMVKSAVQHPVQTLLMSGACAAACFFLPWAGTALTVGFAALGVFHAVQGVMASRADRAAGNGAQAELDFEQVGSGAFEVAAAIGPALFQKWLNRVRGQEPHVGTGGKTTRTRGPKAPKATKTTGGSGPKAPKAPKAVKPAKPDVDVTNIGDKPSNGAAHVGSSPAKPAPAPKVHHAPKAKPAPKPPAPKPATEVTNIGDKPSNGRAHVGSAPARAPKAVKPAAPKAKPAVHKADVAPPKPATDVTDIGDKPTNGPAHVGSSKAPKAPKAKKPVAKPASAKGKVAPAAKPAKAPKAAKQAEPDTQSQLDRLQKLNQEMSNLIHGIEDKLKATK